MALIPPVTRLTASIIRILGCNPSPMTLQGTNTYLIGNGKRRILIDTGDPNIPEYVNHLKKVLENEQTTIGTILLTHHHHDHVGGVRDLLRSEIIDKAELNTDCKIYKFPRTDSKDWCPEIPPEVEIHKLSDQEEFITDGAKLRIIHTPGHTTDHAVITTDDGILFSGDCILGEGTAVFEDLYNYMESLKKILHIKPQIIYPGHGNIITDPIEKIKFYIDHRNEREKQILQFFEKNPEELCLSIDVVQEIYKETPKHLWGAAAINVGHHLVKLHKEGKLDSHDEGDIRYYTWPEKKANLEEK